MVNYLKKIWLFSFLLIHLLSNAQFYESGQDPASLKWKQIHTDNFQLIFPEDFSCEANRIANILEYIYNYAGNTLSYQPKKISVILHNHSLNSNGYVVWAPKRMELVSTPPQNIYPQDWLEQLAIHEFRHVVQIEKLNQGITKIASFILGEQAIGSITGLMPKWFLEGDAVVAETGLSDAGRGRFPSFEKALRAQLLSSYGRFSYDKAKMGSYKDFIPNHYELGYPMVAFARQKYGSHFWDSTLNFVGRNSFLVNPFHFGLKKYGEISNKGLYEETFDYLETKWKIQEAKTKPTPYVPINNKKKKFYTNYRNLIPINDSTYFAIKSGIDQIKEFILIDSERKETKIVTPGLLSADRVNYSNNILVWSEFIADIRWENQNYSVIKLFDLKKGKLKILTKKTRFFAPSISPNLHEIATIEITEKNKYYLTLINAENSDTIRKFESPSNQYIQYPQWDETGNNIFVISLNNKGKAILKLNIETKEWNTIIEATTDNIQRVFPLDKYVFYTNSCSGIENIYVLDTITKQVHQVSSSRFGVSDLFVNKKYIYYSDYSSMGFNSVKSILNKENWIPIENIKNHSVKLFKNISEQENKIIESDKIPNKAYEIKSYKKWKNLFNLHSWAPYHYDYHNLGNTNSLPSQGISILSQNKLSTSTLILGYEYDTDYHYFHSNYSYKGWFPTLEFGYDYIDKRYANIDSSFITRPGGSQIQANISFPLNISRNKNIRIIKPSLKVNYDYSMLLDISGNSIIGIPFEYSFKFYNYIRLSKKDIIPKWGETLTLRYSHLPFDKKNFGNIFSIQSYFYSPGILKHHGTKIKLAYQKQNPKKYFYPYLFLKFPRGFSHKKLNQSGINMYRVEELYELSFSYINPIIYPDLNLYSILYLKRIRSELFYDYSNLRYQKSNTENNQTYWTSINLESFGVELLADYHLFRITIPIYSGIRYTYLPIFDQNNFEFIFGIDFSLYQ